MNWAIIGWNLEYGANDLCNNSTLFLLLSASKQTKRQRQRGSCFGTLYFGHTHIMRRGKTLSPTNTYTHDGKQTNSSTHTRTSHPLGQKKVCGWFGIASRIVAMRLRNHSPRTQFSGGFRWVLGGYFYINITSDGPQWRNRRGEQASERLCCVPFELI